MYSWKDRNTRSIGAALAEIFDLVKGVLVLSASECDWIKKSGGEREREKEREREGMSVYYAKQ